MDTKGTIVIGGGIIGATTLWELSRRDVPAILLEARSFGHESTGMSAAIVRMHYSNAVVVRMALRSRSAFRSLPNLLDTPPVYHKCGWLFLVDEANIASARTNRDMQLSEGSHSEEIEIDDLARLLPGVHTSGIAYALFEEESGFANPTATTEAYIRAAEQNGAEARTGSRVERILVHKGRVTGVIVEGQRVACEHVVIAAGAWSKDLVAGVGVELPMMITREQDVLYETGRRASVPFSVSSQVDRVYMRPVLSDGGSVILVGRGFPKEYERVNPNNFDRQISNDFENDVRTRVARRFPALNSMRMIEGRVGLYAAPPDWHPILGRVDEIDGLHLATGGSGHCFKLGPAIGELVADSILGEATAYADIEKFSINRFKADGATFTSTFGGNRA